MARQSPELLQTRYVENIGIGMSDYAAAKNAGYAKPDVAVARLRKNEKVQKRIAKIRAENAEMSKFTRSKAIEMAQEIYDAAKLLSDPAGMRGALQEMIKMHGFYEPERVEIHNNVSIEHFMRTIETIPDEELFEALEGEFKLLEQSH